MSGKRGTANRPSGTIHRTIDLLDGAIGSLGANVDNADVERIGVMIHRAMSAQQRSFHTPDHIFALCDHGNPHSTLAALFHDLIYFQVDQGFDPEIKELIRPFIRIDAGRVTLAKRIPRRTRAFHGCLAVFGFVPGQLLSPYGGLNEFLSALTMAVLFVDRIADVDLMTAAACIEATIPFRGADADGRGPTERLADRLRTVVDQFNLPVGDGEIGAVVEQAVRFANRDVENFAEAEVASFLDNTWKLLPETNPGLRVTGVYTIRSYATALLRMERFMSGLDASTIFQRYGSTPAPDEYASLLSRATRNVADGRRYLQVKLATAAILLALADLSGGDAPVALFMGEIDPKDPNGTLTAHMPPTEELPAEQLNPTVHALLAYGRAGSSAFDMQQSPLSLRVYCCLGDRGLDAILAPARALIDGSDSAARFLGRVPADLVSAVATGASAMAFTRRSDLDRVARTGTADDG